MMRVQFNNQTRAVGLASGPYQIIGRLVFSGVAILTGFSLSASAEPGLSPNPPTTPPLPNSTAVIFSSLRLLGALAIVLAIFFGGIWLFRRWQHSLTGKGELPKLRILETKALGQRHAIHLVGYEQQRLLVAASPAGLTLLAPLPSVAANATVVAPTADTKFADALSRAFQCER